MDKPHITIKSDGSVGGTHVYTAEGVELNDVYEANVHFTVDNWPQATLKIYEINGEIQAELAAIEKKIIPPLRLEESIQLRITEPRRHFGRMRSRYYLTKFIPLNTWGTKTQLLGRGWMAPVGPITIERMVK